MTIMIEVADFKITRTKDTPNTITIVEKSYSGWKIIHDLMKYAKIKDIDAFVGDYLPYVYGDHIEIRVSIFNKLANKLKIPVTELSCF